MRNIPKKEQSTKVRATHFPHNGEGGAHDFCATDEACAKSGSVTNNGSASQSFVAQDRPGADLSFEGGTRAAGDAASIDTPQTSSGAKKPATPSAKSHAHDASGGAAIISVCTILSRLTGFARTWAMAFALGATFLSSSYQVANNLPNMLYELVMGGVLSTAFLPVYMAERKRAGAKASDDYASNLLTLICIALGVVALLCIAFPAQVIYTQSFYSDQQTMGTSTLLFRFFAVQIVFYGVSAILSGILNANRDYIWGAIAPVFNNVIVIATFLAYAAIAPINETLALYVIAIGNPLGVFVQLAIQIPGARRAGIHLRPYLNLHDPALRETAAIGLPAIVVTICSFATVSVANAASYAFADNGPSVIAYSRLWFTFPYSFLAIPVATTMFTEISALQTEGRTRDVARGIGDGCAQIAFLCIPMAAMLIVFATPLVTLYHVGAFTDDAIEQIAAYLRVLAVALPFYGVNTYLQMVFSAIRRMGAFSAITLAGSAAQVAIIAAAVALAPAGAADINWIAAATAAAYIIGDVAAFAYLAKKYGEGGGKGKGEGEGEGEAIIKPVLLACLRGVLLGVLGGALAALLLFAFTTYVHAIDGSLVLALIYTVVCGCVGCVVAYGIAVAAKLPEAAFVINIVGKIASKLKHR